MPGQLFTSYFLEEGILHTQAWQESLSQSADFNAFRNQAHALLENAASRWCHEVSPPTGI